MTKQIIFLKNKTVPEDKYATESGLYDYDKITHLPLIQHRHCPEDLLKLLRDPSYMISLRYLIVTSQRSVECINESILPYIDEQSKRKLLNSTVFTVGPSTAEFLRRIGFEDVRGEETGNGDMLADYIIENIPSFDGEFLFLVGRTRKEIIKNKLSNGHFNVREMIVYETAPLDRNLSRFKDELLVDAIAWLVFFSPQGTDEIIEYIKDCKSDIQFKIASIGPSTEKFLVKHSLAPDVVSPHPEPKSLLKSIEKHH
ncbi:hypothetical protein KAFR_0A04180 [Kazachstania africana CBS 2517]|uniref:Tetrapyrrole biosynthesis uroporphyrinogen III synthase domain-containing protein n=1 Tax=Kazachstania africana (strain ATCC 22294 / BCRC 22015 / CBS 2517 / CECT 1963 / NBRC 1671 / NRRL Y-8276) TaxID=1071382 RepID=H2ANA3_KAZAF|nr:hypothetical protein KAFR_0A04180 [Kazachstania africana CBS 2517]CCF55853.1 hypothetical protein KAFR_0A04180 [Kazachstania africana CBS 2517]